jgi:hypothetical protein
MSDEFDPRFRDALVGLADRAPDGDDLWERTGSRIAQRRRRKTALSAGGSALAVLAIVVGVVALAQPDHTVVVSPGPGSQPQATIETPTSIGATQPVAPDERVVARLDGTITVVDENWNTTRVLSEFDRERFIRQLAVSPDGTHVYALVDLEPGPYGSDCADLIDVNLTRGTLTKIASARSFALSADGRSLALGMHGDGAALCRPLDANGAAVVNVVDTESFNVIATYSGDETSMTQVEALAWDTDSLGVAAQVCDETCRLLVLSRRGQGLAAVGPVVPAPPADQISGLVWGDSLRTLDRCCEEGVDGADTRTRLRVVDPATGALVSDEQVFDSWRATPETELLVVDGALYALQLEGTPGAVEGTLYRLDGGTAPAVADGISAVGVRG